MLDRFKNWAMPDDEKRQEALSAYLDGALSPREVQVLEKQLARDDALRSELAQLRVVKEQLTAMPRRRAPRSFALNPAMAGRPQSQPLLQLYPVLRTATALSALVLVFVITLGIFQGSLGLDTASPAAEAVILAPEDAEVTRVVTEAIEAEEPLPAAAVEQRQALESTAVEDSAAFTMEAEIAEEEEPAVEEEAIMAEQAVVEDEAAGAGPAIPEATEPVEPNLFAATVEVESEEDLAALNAPPQELPPPVLEQDLADTSASATVATVEAEASEPTVSLATAIALVAGLAFVFLLFLTLYARRRIDNL